MKQFTEGQWLINKLSNPKDPHYVCIYSKEGGPETIEHICNLSKKDSPNFLDNALLISESKNLLKSLKTLVESYSEDGSISGFELDIARKLVNKFK